MNNGPPCYNIQDTLMCSLHIHQMIQYLGLNNRRSLAAHRDTPLSVVIKRDGFQYQPWENEEQLNTIMTLRLKRINSPHNTMQHGINSDSTWSNVFPSRSRMLHYFEILHLQWTERIMMIGYIRVMLLYYHLQFWIRL